MPKLPTFIGEPIRVEGGVTNLRAFVWRGTRFEVRQVLLNARSVDLAASWWRRRHQAVVTVETTDGRLFELHRSGPVSTRQGGTWTLFEELDPLES